MIVDFDDFPDGYSFDADICVVGCGAAGITIAREFLDTKFKVVILESGGEEWEDATQDLYASEVTGLPHKGIHAGRARIFGGTTTLWAGQTLPLDEIDFRKRPWTRDSGWPIDRSELEPFYRRAERVLNLNPIDYTASEWPYDWPPPPVYDRSKLRPLVSQFSPRPDFAAAYRKELKAAERIIVVLHANVVRLGVNAQRSALDEAEFRTLAGKCGRVTARFYVLCCGGIETARLLLASDDVETDGLGNRCDLVGRYFQDHVQAQLAPVILHRPLALSLYETFYWRGIAYNPKAALSEKLQEGRRTLNATAGVVSSELPNEDSPVEAAKRVVRRVLGRGPRQALGPDLRRVLSYPLEVASAGLRRLRLHGPAYAMSGEPCLAFQCECEPNPLSRVVLSSERDSLGMRRSRLDWRLTPLVLHTAKVVLETMADELERLGLGTVDVESSELLRGETDWERRMWDNNHHIGTCRMSSDPQKGVVDSQCRMHTVENLFIAGSAVFPTSGHSNPTFTILALAIRLADHFKVLLGRAR